MFRRAFEVRRATLRDSGIEAYVKATPLFMYPPKWIADNAAKVMAAETSAIETFPPPEVMERLFASTAGIGAMLGG